MEHSVVPVDHEHFISAVDHHHVPARRQKIKGFADVLTGSPRASPFKEALM